MADNTEKKEIKKVEKVKIYLETKNADGYDRTLGRINKAKHRIDDLIQKASEKPKQLEQESKPEEKKVKKPLPPAVDEVVEKPTEEVQPDVETAQKPVANTEGSSVKQSEESDVKAKEEKNAEKIQPKGQDKPEKVESPKKTKITSVKLNQQPQTDEKLPSYVKRIYVEPPKPPARQPRENAQQQKPSRQNNQGTQRSFDKNAPHKQAGQQSQKPVQSRPQKSTGAVASSIPVVSQKSTRRIDDKKRDLSKQLDDKKGMSKRTLIRKGFITEEVDDDRITTRKLKNKKAKETPVFQPIKIEKAVITTENLTVKILSEKIGKTAQEIIKQLMMLGIMCNINSVVDFQTMELVASEFGVELELKLEQTQEEKLEQLHEEEDSPENLVKRPPIITVMGHVDHGKTSLLDAIRKTNVATGEAGGITQHIGAYSVQCKGETITFLDTPGHEAFTEMRARGAFVTDIVILIVAADDGIMPQTIEAINHAKAAKVPIVVAINKIDKPAANVEKVKQMLTDHELVPEEWGGDVMVVPISAKKGIGIDKLLESILFLAEYNEYKANPKRMAKCSIIEAKLDRGKGPVANVIVQNGTLHVGDYLVSGMTSGRVRAMVDDKGRNIKEAGPSTPVSILGFTDVPNAGDSAVVVEDEKMARHVIEEREAKKKNEAANQSQMVNLDDVFNKINEGQIKQLDIIVKADVQGSVEALRKSLHDLSNDEVKVSVIHGAVGAINKSDVMLAGVSNAIIIGFNVRPDSEGKSAAEANGVDIRLYNVIYDAIDDVSNAMKGLVAPKFKEVVTGRAQVRSVFKISSVGEVAGSYVLTGKMVRNSQVRIYRNNIMIFEGNLNNLKRFKDDAKEVAQGFECGISVENFVGFMENDEIECFVMEEVK